MEEPKQEKPQFEIIEKALTLMILILGLSVLAPFIVAAFHSKDVALVAMILEVELDSQFWMIVSALVAALGINKVGKNKP